MIFRRLLAVTIASLLLAACSGRQDAASTASEATAPKANASNIHAVARERLRDGGTFTWPMRQTPTNFNLLEIDGSLLDGLYVIGAFMPVTFENDSEGTPVWDRDILASEPVLTMTNGQVVTYEINPQAVWYDGTPITWQDFYWQWKANNGTNLAYHIAAANGYEDIGNVERGKDDREVIVTYRRPFADWQSLFSPFYPASTNEDPQMFNEGWVDHPLTSAGPFKFDSFNRTTQTITFVRNEKWWGLPAKVDRLVFRTIDDKAQVDALANGEVDAAPIAADANMYHRAQTIESAELRSAGAASFRHLTINATSPMLTDVRVRRALAMGIDRTAIARALLGPLGLPPQPLNNHVFVANQRGYRDNSGEVGRYDPDRAAQLLDEAGWRLQDGVRRKDGQALEIKCVIQSTVQASRQEAELIQNTLARIGVKVNINPVPTNDFFEKYVTPGQFDVTLFAWIGTPYPISSVKSIYATPTRSPDGQMNIQQNYARVGSPEIDALFAAANAEFDRDRANEIANQADELIWQEVHSLPLYQRPEIIAAKRNLANFGAFGLQTPWPYADIGWVAN
jgi:glutathione transport system substrate-binding protein